MASNQRGLLLKDESSRTPAGKIQSIGSIAEPNVWRKLKARSVFNSQLTCSLPDLRTFEVLGEVALYVGSEGGYTSDFAHRGHTYLLPSRGRPRRQNPESPNSIERNVLDAHARPFFWLSI